MNRGGIRRGLHIDDDDDEVKPAYEHQSLEADRKKTNFEKDLDNMLFGGFGAPPPRRRGPSETKTGNQGGEAPKPATNETKPVTNTAATITASNATSNAQQYGQNNANIKITESTIVTSVNKSTEWKGGVNPSQKGTTTITTTVVASTSTNANLNNSGRIVNAKQNQTSVIVPSEPSKPQNPTGNISVANIPINSKEVLPPPKKVDNYVSPKTQVQPGKTNVPVKNEPAKKPEPEVPAQPLQPARYEQPITIETLHPIGFKNQFNKPGYVRKLKKVAEDFKFAEENVSLHSAVDVVRPFETDRGRQRKLNDFDFKDYEFPSISSSLGSEHKGKASIWKKQNQLAKTVSFGKYIDPNDINPGTLSNPHFVSTLSALAQLQINTKRLIEDQKVNSNGFYLIRVFVNSVWRYITVESTLPYIDGQHAGVVSNPDSEFQLSPALIEKAYAKVFGGYDTFSRIQPREHYLRDLTGAPVKKIGSDHPDLGSIIKKAIAAGQIVLAVPNEKIATLGLNPNYSYPLINFTAKGSMELRNSFGTIEERSKLSFRPEGTFDLGSAQVRDLISHVLITNVNIAYNTSTIQSRHRHGFYSSYAFKIRKDTHGFLSVNQWDERLFPLHAGYEYSPFHIVLQRVEEDGTATFINAAFTAGSRNLDLEVNLTPGSYTVFVSANWKQTQFPYNLTFYGSNKVDFERVYTEKVPNLISQSLENINVNSGRRTELGRNAAQYFLYHPESNLVILTVENTTDRDSTVTIDLSKVKFDHLTLLTAHNNEQNYSNKVGSEIEQYKQIPLSDRRWSASLQGQGRFTWILGSDQPYNQSNPKSWGFN